MKTKKLLHKIKDHQVSAYGLSSRDYFIGSHGEIRNRFEKFHGSKKDRLRARREALKQAKEV